MVENVNEYIIVNIQLTALGEIVPEKQFIDKLLNVDRELSYPLPTFRPWPAPPLKISSVDSPTATVSITGRITSSSNTDTPADGVSSAVIREDNVHLQQPQPQIWLR